MSIIKYIDSANGQHDASSHIRRSMHSSSHLRTRRSFFFFFGGGGVTTTKTKQRPNNTHLDATLYRAPISVAHVIPPPAIWCAHLCTQSFTTKLSTVKNLTSRMGRQDVHICSTRRTFIGEYTAQIPCIVLVIWLGIQQRWSNV